DEVHAFRSVLVGDLDEIRRLGAARRTPCGEKIYDDEMSVEVLQMNGLARRIPTEVGSGSRRAQGRQRRCNSRGRTDGRENGLRAHRLDELARRCRKSCRRPFQGAVLCWKGSANRSWAFVLGGAAPKPTGLTCSRTSRAWIVGAHTA